MGDTFLMDQKKIRVFIDSKSFDEMLTNNDRLASAILRHEDSEFLDFVRFPLVTANQALKNIKEYRFDYNPSSKINTIDINGKTTKESIGFGYGFEDIESITRHILKKDEVKQADVERIMPVFIQACFNKFSKSNIYVTNDHLILKNRLWFESHFPGGPLNIMTAEEASEFLDLFYKKKGEYLVSCRCGLNKGFWYLYSMRLKVPHYNFGDVYIGALATRMVYSLTAVDEIGFQYYSGSNNDTMDDSLYHFNYLISLITGIFDNLALETDKKLSIHFPIKERISLSNRRDDFLKEIRKKEPALRDYISTYANFIQTIYLFRELVLHREGLRNAGFSYKDKDIVWKANFIRITEKMNDYIRNMDSQREYDPFTEWGRYLVHKEMFVEPYHFSKSAVKLLIEFVDGYLKLLGYSSFIEQQKKKKDDEFTRTMLFFEQYKLGF